MIRRLLYLLAALALVGGCAGNPAKPSTTPTPTDPTPDPPKLACPAPVTVRSTDGQAFPVTYGTPTVSFGKTPLTGPTCTPPSGQNFPLGTSTVTCTVSDALQRTDTCSLTVVVQPPLKLTVTRFVAFGDSMTFGTLAIKTLLFSAGPSSYPDVLHGELVSRYPTQAIVIDDQGQPGESAVDARSRLSGILVGRGYDVVLLLDGANDLLDKDALKIAPAATAMQFMIRDAKSRGVLPFLATLPPQRPGLLRSGGATLVEPYNDQLRSIAASENVPLVDVFAAFGADAATLIGDDGLHPTAAGYQRIADTFFTAISQRLEQTSITMSTLGTRRLQVR